MGVKILKKKGNQASRHTLFNIVATMHINLIMLKISSSVTIAAFQVLNSSMVLEATGLDSAKLLSDNTGLDR